MTPWLSLLVAGFFEIGFTTSLKLSEGQTKLFWTVSFYFCVVASFYFLDQAVRSIPMGTAYAVWTGIGAAGTALIGIFFFKEPATFLRLAFLIMLIGSIVGLKAVSGK
ncbi:MAG: multidrug efflux SMR transporter [Pseudomonadota bacterium]|nr:multidrug efflux SMR transporter [Pseudomonadota bacterium]